MVLGKGIDFEIEVLPWAPSVIQGDLELISPIPVVYPSPDKLRIRSPANGPLNGTSSTPTCTIGPALHSNETVKSRHATKEIRFSLPTLSASTTVDPPDIQIGETPVTTVVKRIRSGMVSAIKICRRPTVSGSASAWKNEMEILNRLNHTSIVRLLDHDVPNMRLELEYGGRDLHKFANDQKMSQLSEEAAYQIWKDISSGLEYIHSQEIFHLDIKPGNILVGDTGRAKICDFGHSLQFAVEPVYSSIGTHAYIPPEFIVFFYERPSWGCMGCWTCHDVCPRYHAATESWLLENIGYSAEVRRCCSKNARLARRGYLVQGENTAQAFTSPENA